MPEKDFDRWNSVKKFIDKKSFFSDFKEGEIWWCNLGVNVGYEINGKQNNFSRPVLILKSYGKNGAIILPFTSKFKNNNFIYYIKENNYINLTQIRFLDSKRFIRKVGEIEKIFLKDIKNKINYILK